MSIPASAIVQVNPGVLSGGGSALDLSGLFLTNDASVPIGTVEDFSNQTDVANFFGSTSNEAAMATSYFAGFDNKTKTPGQILFAQYPAANVGAYLRGGSLASMTLTALKALSGTLIVTVDGTLKTSSSINLSAATLRRSLRRPSPVARTSLGTASARRSCFRRPRRAHRPPSPRRPAPLRQA